jgi:simple sugar transport system permease protein
MVITTLMMNYVANSITSYFVTYPLKDTSGDGLAIQTPEIAEALRLPRLSTTSTFNAGFIVAILVVLLVLFITKKTVFGYESKMGGFNPSFALYGGTKQAKVMMITMALAGAIACVAGCTDVFGLKYRYADGMLSTTSYAWTGLQAALIAGLDPIGMFFVSIFLAGLQIGGNAIQRSLGIPLEIATIIQCCITLFVSVKITIRFVKKSKAAKEGGKQA